MLITICRVGVRRMEPDSFQWCPATGQGATGTNWSIGSSVWTWGRTSSLWGWRSPGTGWPGRLWSLLLWRYSGPAWTRSCAICSRWPCFGGGGWTRWPTEIPFNPYHSVILWFCDFVCKHEIFLIRNTGFYSTTISQLSFRDCLHLSFLLGGGVLLCFPKVLEMSWWAWWGRVVDLGGLTPSLQGWSLPCASA